MTSIRAARGSIGEWKAEVNSLDDLQEALVAVHELWRRSPGERRWPFAGDAPWHLMQGEVGDLGAAEQSDTLITTEAGRELRVRKVDTLRPRVALDAREVAERDRVTGWLQLLSDPVDRRVVWAATGALARGEGRVPWGALKVSLRWPRTPRALAWRYATALADVLCRVNGWPANRARGLALAGFSREDGSRDG